jgi:hypothetical protein
MGSRGAIAETGQSSDPETVRLRIPSGPAKCQIAKFSSCQITLCLCSVLCTVRAPGIFPLDSSSNASNFKVCISASKILTRKEILEVPLWHLRCNLLTFLASVERRISGYGRRKSLFAECSWRCLRPGFSH